MAAAAEIDLPITEIAVDVGLVENQHHGPAHHAAPGYHFGVSSNKPAINWE